MTKCVCYLFVCVTLFEVFLYFFTFFLLLTSVCSEVDLVILTIKIESNDSPLKLNSIFH